MRNFKRMVLLSLAVLGTAFAFADGDSEKPIVDVSPQESVVTPNVEFMMTISYTYTRKVIIIASGTTLYERNMAFWNAYEPDVRSFDYYSVIENPNTSRTYEITAYNDGYSQTTYANYVSTNVEL